MQTPPIPENEAERLQTLKDYAILDTLPEQDFDDLTLLASHICGTPIALISLVDDHRQWFKSKVGLDAPETPKDIAFCAHAILQDEPMVINDSFKDERFFDNPLATQAPDVRFYAGTPLIAPNGLHIGTICVIDNHPRDGLSPEQAEALIALSRQVISQLELRVASKKAEVSTRAKSLFLANMSHEIRTPMNAVISCTHLLQDVIKDEQSRELLNMIDRAGDSLLTLINDILDFSKIESGKFEIEFVPFDIHTALEDITSLLLKRADEFNIKFQLTIDNTMPRWVMGDITRFRQIVINLVGNAIKFSKSRVSIHLSSTVEDDQNIYQLSVKDNGIGISEEDQDGIFQDFNQIDASITAKYGGTGLGLSICSGIVKTMGGDIQVESELGKGSNFIVSLPLEVSDAIQSNIRLPLSEINPGLASKHPLSILLAEDDMVNQIIIRQIFEKVGYSIDTASDGNETLVLSTKKDYDIIFMDMRMPKLDGLETTKAIRATHHHQPVIIALTANAFLEDKQSCLAAGMDGFLTKPVDLGAIVAELMKVINAAD